MVKITWHNGDVPNNLEVRQVYGLVFTQDGRMLIKAEEKKGEIFYSYAGGTPEKFDADHIATLRREMIEEVNTTLNSELYVVGYQEIEGDGDKPVYAQLRMVGMIDKIGPVMPDPDNGKTYQRLLVSPKRAIELLNWGECGRLQTEEAVKIAKEKFGLTEFSDNEEYV